MQRHLSLVLAGAALAASFAATPAQAHHTLCDNEATDVWVGQLGGVGAGADLETPPHVCVFTGLTGTGGVLVVVRPGGQQTVCTYYTNNNNPADDTCFVV
jgi:hypothetical protein